jgi:ribulose-phosphate 3-epimerase
MIDSFRYMNSIDVSTMTIKKEIIPAIIAKTQEELDERLLKVKDYVKTVQLDVMDNIFVPNTSLFFDFDLKEIDLSYEAHLMVEKPQNWIKNHAEKVDTILVHYESIYDDEQVIRTVKNLGKRIGFVLNPETSVEKLDNVIDEIDQVLIMTVKPGFYGSPFLPEMMDKIQKLRLKNPDLDIEVDGGITDKTIQQVYTAGANLFVSGSYIVKSEYVQRAIDSLKNLIK